MKIAVTAASGQLGKAIIKSSIEKFGKENVIGLARNMNKAKNLGIEIRKGDYDKKEDFLESLKGIDVVLLVSSMGKPEDRPQQHLNVINAAKENGVKKIVYTSIISDSRGTTFNAIVESNRQTEEDIKNSGMEWSIGRNGLYIEPDVEYIDYYLKEGKIENCAGNGKCAYVSREELGNAYAEMIADNKHNGYIYNLTGYNISQSELAELINKARNTNIVFEDMEPEAYEKERTEALGTFFGKVISGIYTAIRNGGFDVPSDFETVMGRKHKALENYFIQS